MPQGSIYASERRLSSKADCLGAEELLQAQLQNDLTAQQVRRVTAEADRYAAPVPPGSPIPSLDEAEVQNLLILPSSSMSHPSHAPPFGQLEIAASSDADSAE